MSTQEAAADSSLLNMMDAPVNPISLRLMFCPDYDWKTVASMTSSNMETSPAPWDMQAAIECGSTGINSGHACLRSTGSSIVRSKTLATREAPFPIRRPIASSGAGTRASCGAGVEASSGAASGASSRAGAASHKFRSALQIWEVQL